jgi:hypothetical protein
MVKTPSDDARAFSATMTGWVDDGGYENREPTPEEKAEYDLINSMHACGRLSSDELSLILRARIAFENQEMNAKADEIIRKLFTD